MRAVLLAGGKGTRLFPYTAVFPKPLVPLGEKPILEILLRRLRKHGFKKVTLCVGHMSYLIQTFFKDGQWLDMEIDYSLEDKPLGTVGPLALIEDLPDLFLVANGDLLTDANFKKMVADHKQKKALLTIGVYNRAEKMELGVLEVKNKRVVNYLEKPTKNYLISAGVYIFDKKVLKYVEAGKHMDFPKLVNLLLKKKVKINYFLIKGFWLDIGRPDDYQKAVEMFTADSKRFVE
jgi:NDP-sugar pyrophosphorylase family protein